MAKQIDSLIEHQTVSPEQPYSDKFSMSDVGKEQFDQLQTGNVDYFKQQNKKIANNVIENTIVFGNYDAISTLENVLELGCVRTDSKLQIFRLIMANKRGPILKSLLKMHKSHIASDKTFENALRKMALETNDVEIINIFENEFPHSDRNSEVGDDVDHKHEVNDTSKTAWNRLISFVSPCHLFGNRKNSARTNYESPEGGEDICKEMRKKLDEYHVKTNQRYLFTTADPIEEVIKNSNELIKMKKDCHQNKDEIEILISRCKNFMRTLVDLCENGDEIGCLFTDKSASNSCNNINKQNRFWQALEGELTECITHPDTQNWLYKRWLGKKPVDWVKKSWYSKALCGAGNILFFPFQSFYQVVALPEQYFQSNSDLTPEEYAIDPIDCFSNSVASHVFFLATLLYAIFDKKPLPEANSNNQPEHMSTAQYVMLVWLVAYFYGTINDFTSIIYPSYRRSWWTVYQFVTLILFWIASACFVVTEFDIDITSKQYLLIVSDGCRSIAITMAFIKVLQWFHLSSTLGPFIISFSKMVTAICQLLIIFTVVIFAFSFGMFNLYRHVQFPPQEPGDAIDDDKTFFNNYVNTLKMLFWTLFGYGRASAAVIPNDDGLTDVNRIIMQMGYCVWAFFHITFVIVLLNMLIAVMTTSYEIIQKSCDANWKLARTKIWLYYIAPQNAIAPPFNLLRYVRIAVVAFYTLMVKSDNYKQDNVKLSQDFDIELESANEKSDGNLLTSEYEGLIMELRDRYKIKHQIEKLAKAPKLKSSSNSNR